MMYIHYCKNCLRVHILNGHKTVCPACQASLTELKLPYLTYVEMDYAEREKLLDRLKFKE